MYNERRKSEDYVFEDIHPIDPDINLDELEKIQNKIEDFTSGKNKNGLTVEETEQFLDWVIYNARSFAVAGTGESIETASMAGECASTQKLNRDLLMKLGLDVKAFNISECIGDIPMNYEDKEREKNGWGSRVVKHAISMVNIPVIDPDGDTVMCKFLLDPTFRQFCLKENCNEEKYDENSWSVYSGIAPHPAYFMQKGNLVELGESEKYANESENLCKKLISDGYFYLSEKNAKLYGDAFVRSSKRLEFQDEPIRMSGANYIYNFENNPAHILEESKDNLFTRLPSEIKQSETGFLKKVIDFFKEKFSKKPKMLPSGMENKEVSYRDNKVDVKLRDEDLRKYRTGEKKILQEYGNNKVKTSDYKSKNIEEYEV